MNLNYSKRIINQWHVVYTYPNLEKKVQTNLLKKGIVNFLPLQKQVRQWSDRKKTFEVPLFPNYIFVYTNTYERFKVHDVPGVAYFVSSEGTPVTVSDTEINMVKKIIFTPDFSVDKELILGDLVQVTDGPFVGQKGLLFERKGKKRFGVKIESLNQTISVEINGAFVEKLGEVPG